MNFIEVRCVNSLAKVFPDINLKEPPYQNGSVLRNEVFSIQAAYRTNRLVKRLHVEVITGSQALKPLIHRTGLVSCIPGYKELSH
ncbi:MAG: hypothetical protein K1W24_03935 [Lachnospiraceae bacterium]